MSNNNGEPKKFLVLVNNDQIRGYVNPTRMALLQLLGKGKRTISSVARELGVHPANITHHFKLLERVGLIRLVEKRDTGKNLEKYYRAAAYAFEIAPSDSRMANKKALGLSILKNDLSAAINTVQENDERKTIAFLATAKISPHMAGKFAAQLEKLVKDFKSHDSKAEEAYTINLSLYPSEVKHPDSLSKKEIQL